MEFLTLNSEYFNHEIISEPPHKLQRVDFYNCRYYYTYIENQLIVFPGVTALIKKVLPTPEELIIWRIQKGEVESQRYFKEREKYGTLLHSFIAQYFKSGQFINKEEEVKNQVYDYIEKNRLYYLGINPDFWVEEMQKNMLSFASFIIEREVVPIGVEVPLCSPKYGVATMVDLWCYLTFNKKRHLAIVDFKSGKGLTYDSNKVQLKFCEALVKETYPSLAKEEVFLFNWGPKDWKAAPTYNFVNHTNKVTNAKLQRASEDYYEMYPDLSQTKRLVIDGVMKYGEGLTGLYENKTIEDIIKSNKHE
jgi:hypothetical protein